jgi:hypothetical protein
VLLTFSLCKGIKTYFVMYRDKEGSPWSKLYKKDMSMCAGFESELKGTLPCMPATVIYGHAASRGLDIKRWSIGLDTGCVRQVLD